MICLGVTGRSGCGKSTVTAVFSAHGVPLADADQISREILLPGSPLLPKLAQRFGADILKQDGTLDRRLLADRAFKTAEGTKALSNITHPAIVAELNRQGRQAQQQGANLYFVDGAVIIGSPFEKECNGFVVVTAPLEASVARICARDCITPDMARRRLDAQMPEQELLRWAAEKPDRYILEDDYDSEFRFVGRPIPSLYSTDENQRVVYLNTFSKTIAPSIRISYMILPPSLLERYRKNLGFYSCTVSGFEQYTLAKFLEQGHFERHLGRMRNRYRQKRDQVMGEFLHGPLAGRVKITGQDAGLHFLAELQTKLPDAELQRRAAEKGLRLAMLSDYYHEPKETRQHTLVVNYSGLELQCLPRALEHLADIMREETTCTTN